MPYVVEQKIKDNIYLYRVESYWDKSKKQARQKRTYIGPKDKKLKSQKIIRSLNIIHKKYGNIVFLEEIAKRIHLEKILGELFLSDLNEIFALAFFLICNGEALYTFPYWLNENHMPKSKILYSTDISALCERIGESQKQQYEFFNKWIKICSPRNGIYYDITSISSYATNLDFVEWGYNRDKENLAQINIGIMCSAETSLPLYYRVYPGSIVDVTTLNNCIKYISMFFLEKIILILDRGFCSKSNIAKLNGLKDKIRFIQPLTFSMNKVKQLIKIHHKELKNMRNAFKYDEEILFYLPTLLEMDGIEYHAHIFFNEKEHIEQRHTFLSELFDIEKEIGIKKFSSMNDYLDFRKNYICDKYKLFFKLNKNRMVIEKNPKSISEHLSKAGYFVLLSNAENLDKISILNYYRDRDKVEKMFNVEKNNLDSKRLRAHNNYNVDGRIFIKFIALILYSYISNIMKNKKLFNTFSVKELLGELSKIRYTCVNKNAIVSEVTKTQRKILEAFSIDPALIS